MGSNIERLGDIMTGRMKKTSAAAVPTTTELGIINKNLSLTTDSLPTAIPKGDYMVNLMLTGRAYRTSAENHTHSGGSHGGHEGGNGSHTHNDGEHSHELPSEFRSLKEGDRVLVMWCGNEPIVIAIVVSS